MRVCALQWSGTAPVCTSVCILFCLELAPVSDSLSKLLGDGWVMTSAEKIVTWSIGRIPEIPHGLSRFVVKCWMACPGQRSAEGQGHWSLLVPFVPPVTGVKAPGSQRPSI